MQKINIIIIKNNIKKHLTIHLNALEIHYKSIYIQLVFTCLSVHIGLMLPRLCLLLCPIPLRKGEPSVGVFLCLRVTLASHLSQWNPNHWFYIQSQIYWKIQSWTVAHPVPPHQLLAPSFLSPVLGLKSQVHTLET